MKLGNPTMILLVLTCLGSAAVEAGISKVSSVSEPLPSDSAQKMAQNMYDNQQNEQCGLTWVPHSGGDRVPYSMYIGMEAGHEVLVARSLFAGRLKPGKFVQGGSGMTIAHGDQEMSRGEFQVLTNPANKYTKWLRYEKALPAGAIVGGSVDGKVVYIGRTKHQGHKVVGYLNLAQNKEQLVYTWNGDAYTSDQFELLIVKNCQVVVETTKNDEQRAEETRREEHRPEKPNQESQNPVVQPRVHPGQPEPKPQPKPQVPEWQKKAEKQGKKWANQIESKAKKEGQHWKRKFEDKAKHEGAKWKHQAKKETHKWQRKINHQVDSWKRHKIVPSHHSHRSHHHHIPSFHVPKFHIPHFG